MAQGAKQVDIRTYLEIKYVSGSRDSGGLTVDVTKDIPWDKLSKLFKKYTYTIQYSPEGFDSQYNINVLPKSGSGSTSDTFRYMEPSKRVDKVEVFFKGDADVKKVEPLVVRFEYQNEYVDYGSSGDSNKYYRWSVLKGKSCTSTILHESVTKNELITVLLEELGNTGGVSDRKDKLVIRLDERPTNVGGGRSDHKYPATGFYKDHGKQVTVKKARDTGIVAGVEGFEHTVATGVSATEFYVSYDNDSRYFKIGPKVGVTSGQAILHSVTGHFETAGSRTKKLVLIVFTFTEVRGIGDGKSYGYSYHDFFNDLKQVDARDATADKTVKEIVAKDAIEGTTSEGLKRKLNQEKERLKPLISFETGNGVNDTNGNKNVTISAKPVEVFQGQGEHGYKFKKVVIKVNTSVSGRPEEGEEDDDEEEGLEEPGVPGSPVGPWTVFSTKLFNDNNGRTIEDGAAIPNGVLTSIYTGSGLTDISKKYSSITVYYGTKSGRTDNYYDYKALLLEFVPGNGDKKYIKREKGDNQWVNEGDGRGIGISGSTGVTAEELTEIAKHAGIIEDSKPSSVRVDSNPSQGSQEGMSTGTKAAIGTGATVIIGGGAGAGYAIYKYPQVFLSLIGR